MESSSLDENELLSSFMWAAGDPGSDRAAAAADEAAHQSWVAGVSSSIDLGPPQLSTDLHSDEVRATQFALGCVPAPRVCFFRRLMP